MATDPNESVPVAEDASAPAGGEQTQSTGDRPKGRFGRVATVFCGTLLGGLLGWFLIQQFDGAITASPEIQEIVNRQDVTLEEDATATAALAVVRMQQTVLWMTMLGMALAACTGLAAGLIQQTSAAVVRGLIAGLVLGALLGAAGGFFGAQVETQLLQRRAAGGDTVEQMKWGMLTHGVEWAFVGLAVGLSAGFASSGLRGLLHPAMAATIGGIVAAPLYSILAAFLFPVAKSDTAVPVGGGNGLFWTMIAAAFIGLAVSRTLAAAPSDHLSADQSDGVHR